MFTDDFDFLSLFFVFFEVRDGDLRITDIGCPLNPRRSPLFRVWTLTTIMTMCTAHRKHKLIVSNQMNSDRVTDDLIRSLLLPLCVVLCSFTTSSGFCSTGGKVVVVVVLVVVVEVDVLDVTVSLKRRAGAVISLKTRCLPSALNTIFTDHFSFPRSKVLNIVLVVIPVVLLQVMFRIDCMESTLYGKDLMLLHCRSVCGRRRREPSFVNWNATEKSSSSARKAIPAENPCPLSWLKPKVKSILSFDSHRADMLTRLA